MLPKMDMCLAEFAHIWAARHPKVKSVVRDYAEQMSHKSVPMEVDEMAYPADEQYEG